MSGNSICLALGQGGARSLAHIGVLQVFQEAKISVKQISGTSAGAIVGAVFAETADAFETERRFRTLLTSESYAKSGFGRLKDPNANGVNFWEQITLRVKGWLTMSLAQSNLSILRNTHFHHCLKRLLTVNDFSRLRVPFSCMATDLISGCSVEIASGDVITAVNASSAVPGFFPPVVWGKFLLVDGAVGCPVPVEHCGILGQDVIVAVHVASRINSDYQLQNALDVMFRAEEIILWNLDLLKTARADIQIFPDTLDVAWNEVYRLDEMIDSGREAAKAALPQVYDAIAEKKNKKGTHEVLHCEPLFQECRQRFFQKA